MRDLFELLYRFLSASQSLALTLLKFEGECKINMSNFHPLAFSLNYNLKGSNAVITQRVEENP
jgi:hypothetical protein